MGQNRDTDGQSPPDVPITIQGYVTDPKLVGYQLLTNYESTYWRALVGRDAWGLYEVLRSFCHNGNNTCNPSINLLMSILQITDRRQLTGRVTNTRGKERVLPGLIDTLQEFKLATAEVKGEGPTLQYVFHVLMTPPPLSAEHLLRLPETLQRKHEQLLKRVAQNAKSFDEVAQKKAKKGDPDTPSGTLPEGGMAPYQTPPGTVPAKQQPLNTTQITTPVVVEKLIGYSIGKRKAQELASGYPPEYIYQKIELLEWTLETKDSGKTVANPAAWLIRAIEKDYQPPATFTTKDERTKALEELQRSQETWEEIRKAEKEEAKMFRTRVIETYQIPDILLEKWDQVLSVLKNDVSQRVFQERLQDTYLISYGDGVATIGVWSKEDQEWLTARLQTTVSRLLVGIFAEEVTAQFVVLDLPAEA